MPYYAKTYYSSTNWESPSNHNNFGQPIADGYTLGYEEFNFIPEIKELKLLYIPCFSRNKPTTIDQIELFYDNPAEKGLYIYAKVERVSQIDAKEIEKIRKNLEEKNFPAKVEELIKNTETFPTQELKDLAVKAWKGNYNTNEIIAKRTEPRFIFNARYDKLTIYNKPILLERNLTRASILVRK